MQRLCSTGSPVCCSVMTWGDGMQEGREAKEGGDVCIIMADLYGRNQYNIVNFFKYLNLKKKEPSQRRTI